MTIPKSDQIRTGRELGFVRHRNEFGSVSRVVALYEAILPGDKGNGDVSGVVVRDLDPVSGHDELAVFIEDSGDHIEAEVLPIADNDISLAPKHLKGVVSCAVQEVCGERVILPVHTHLSPEVMHSMGLETSDFDLASAA